MGRNRITTIDLETARRAIVIDFEGTRDEPPSLLGMSCAGQWSATIVEPALWPLAQRGDRRGKVIAADLADALRYVQRRAMKERRTVLAWSLREIEAIRAALPDNEMLWWENRLVNALTIARAWRTREGIRITPTGSGNRINKNPLSGYLDAIGYHVPTAHRGGNTADRIRYVRRYLEQYGSVDELTPVQKAKWTKMLGHNRHDCLGVAAVMERVARDAAR